MRRGTGLPGCETLYRLAKKTVEKCCNFRCILFYIYVAVCITAVVGAQLSRWYEHCPADCNAWLLATAKRILPAAVTAEVVRSIPPIPSDAFGSFGPRTGAPISVKSAAQHGVHPEL